MIQIRFVFRDSSGRLHSDKPAKIILPLPLPHQLENGTDMRTIQDAITYLQQREIPKRLWNIENNQVKAVHTVCRNDLETTQQGPMFAIYDNDVIAYSMVPDEDYIIVTSKEEDAVVGDVSTEAMQETQMQPAKNTTTRESLAVEKNSGDSNTVAVANVNHSIAPNNRLNPIQTLDNQATDLASTTAEKESPNKDFDNNTIVEQVPISTTQKRKESTLESDVTTNAKKMKVAMQTDQIQESTIGNANNNVDAGGEHVSTSTTSKCNESVPEKDTAIDSTSVEQSEPSKESASTESPTKSDITPNSPSLGQDSLSTNSTRKESIPECNTATETNKSRVGTLDGQTNKDSDSLFQSTWEEQFQLLRKFYDKNGHSHITKAHRTLGVFASQLKMKSVRDKLTDKQKEDLASVKFDMFNKTRYTRQEQMDKRWMERFEQLKEYKKNHDHMNVRRGEDKTLYQWVSAQRYFKKSSQLPKGRAKLLEEIGFKWESSQVGKRLLSQTSTSVEQVPLLIAPKPKDIMPVGKGSLSQASTSVKQVPILIAPKRKDPIPESGTATETTKTIVGTQTETLDGIKDSKNNTNSAHDKLLTGAQKEDLANVKFDMLDKMRNSQFLVPKRSKNDERWMKRLHKLKEYKNKHGHMMVRGFEDKDLNTWISNQRHYKRSSKLREDRVKLLEEIGFSWESEYHQRTHEGKLNTINTSKDQVPPPKSDIATESIKLKVGTPNENHGGQTNAKSESNCDSLLQFTWKERFRQLKQFHRKNGHSQIAKSHPILGTWATQLTLNSVRDRLTDEQKADLASVSFYLFNRMKNPRVEKLDMRWMERFDKLKEYKSKNGHMKVRRSEDNDLYSWIAAQKGFKRSNKLRKDRDKLLEEIGFQWNSYVGQTETSKRKESTPESNTVTNSTSVEQVPLFISAPKRKDPFAESSIVPDSKQFTRRTNLDERWMERFNKLKEYKRKHGHMMVRGTEDKDLYTWIRNQRNFKRHSQFRNDRMELLEEIGFSWESNTSIAQKRKESTPTSDTATDSTGIEQILPKDPTRKESTQECDTEREPKKLKMMKQTDQNQQRLNEGYINSISDEQSLLSTASKHKESTSESDTAIISKMLQVETQVSFSDSWMNNYHKLKEYKNKHGHTTVLMRENKDLYEWTVYQRDSKRNNELCENRVTLLEEIGFKWSKRRQGFSDERWMNKYDKLQEYKKKYGHVMVQRSQDKELYTWTVTQRFTKRRNELCEDRAKLLEDVGFVWEIDKPVANESAEQKVTDHEKEKVGVRMERWMKNYHKLKDFKKKHGHLILHESHDKGLYRWVLNQRAFKRKGIMYKDRVKLLEDIGFLWDGRLTSKNDANSLSATKDISVPKESPQKPKSRSPSSLNELQKSSSKKRKRATDNDDTKSHTRTFQQPVPEKLAKSLALSTDCENLNKLHQFVRSDLLEIIQENHKIGLQCIFCKASPEPQSRSKIFPQYLENKGLGLYRKVCEWQRVHFKQCTHIPDAVKEKYDELKLADKSRGKVQYWEDSAKQIGLFNKEGGGICFLGDSKDGNAESELSKE
ncbi:hypothetical protein CTEN210_12174 [Chaetoceros tenuissimus]|uniref:Helicase-associated domain-containing protein n=1 Tax=Chaetoceros tenuissimus TaxID=426638 RepID=A0AAD3HA88_9STRA|nr:hypothetical protein CTEN210_12174 [Chaetoceros tenuissimus]